jgi:threonine efflux protein
MLSILIAIWLLHVIATVTPGANTLLIAQLAASDRSSSAVFAAIGVAMGSAVWAALAVLGVNIVFAAFPALRITLQVAGGLYLLYLATRLWSSGNTGNNMATESFLPVAAFYRGVLTNFTNPKAALFFGGVFSACFPADPPDALLMASVLVIFVNALCWYALLAYLFSRQPVREAYLRKRNMVGKVAGVTLGGIGLRFLLLALRDARE